MHWLAAAASRAGLQGAESLVIPGDASLGDAWEIASRILGLPQSELALRLAPVFGLSVANLESAEPQAFSMLPERVARRYHVVPLREQDRKLVIATCDPANVELESAISFAAGRRTVLQLAPHAAIAEALVGGYSAESVVSTLLESVDSQISDAVRVVEEMEPEKVAQQDVDSAPVVKLTNLILRDAVLHRASDVHLEPGPKGGAVRFRVDGVMRHHMHLPNAVLGRVVSRIKVLGKLDITDRIRHQDGRSKVQIEGYTVELRVSTVSTRDAEKAVIRILRPDTAKRLDDVGITPRELARLRQLLACRDGIVVVTGPTGSGKTTTLYAAIKEIATGEVNITTVEDPVEYELAGITQIQVDAKRGVTFANSLRAILRQDPDVIFVGEIRDLETAEIAVQAAMTGHLVLATLHTNDAMGVVARLEDLGLDRQAIAATLRGAIAQRLIRRVCRDCTQPITSELTEEEERLAKILDVAPVTRAVGCSRCGNSGYRDRLPLVEVAVVTPAISDQIASGASTMALQRAAVAAGMANLRDVAIARIRRGETTVQEVERVLGESLQDAFSPAGPPTILLVHEDSAWRRAARALLEGGGFRVVEVPDRAAAFERIAAGEQFELVLTDTGIDSTDLTLAQRLHGKTNGVLPAMPMPLGLPAGLRVEAPATKESNGLQPLDPLAALRPRARNQEH